MRLKKPRKDKLKNLKSYRMFTEFNLTTGKRNGTQ
nr:MAG TPA: hypothetical protein [Bacteriophage sp.]